MTKYINFDFLRAHQVGHTRTKSFCNPYNIQIARSRYNKFFYQKARKNISLSIILNVENTIFTIWQENRNILFYRWHQTCRYFPLNSFESSFIVSNAFSTVFSLSGFTRQHVAGERRLFSSNNLMSIPLFVRTSHASSNR